MITMNNDDEWWWWTVTMNNTGDDEQCRWTITMNDDSEWWQWTMIMRMTKTMMKTKTTMMTMMITITTIVIAKYKINHHNNYFLALFTNVNSSKPNCTMCKLTSFFYWQAQNSKFSWWYTASFPEVKVCQEPMLE